MKLYLLSGGTIDADRAVIFPGDSSRRRVTLPCMQVLVQSHNEYVLFDTGMPVAAVGDPNGLKNAYGMDPNWLRPLVTADERVDVQLQLLGLQVSDLTLVVNTHFHFDHAGANALVAGVPVAAQEAEIQAAQMSDDYLPIWDAPGLMFRAVRGDWSPLPGVEMLHTPGHTPGHQSMIVRFPEQTWLFTWDAVYTEEHWRANKLGTVEDVAQARTSVERLRHVAATENARIIFGHDIGQWESLGMKARMPHLLAEG
ncbi:MAG: N-acyl homoserine lactonase family protein [Chloroflexota bacterium]